MSQVKSFSVGNGDMFYINHNSSNFTIIDCHIDEENAERILNELKKESKDKKIKRFISTHPDEDHILGIKKLDETDKILNFYCVKNNATKTEETESFIHYCTLRDNKSFNIEEGCVRKWMNSDGNDENGDYIGAAGIKILWPNTENKDFKIELKCCEEGGNANNISPIIKYSIEEGASFLWFGDLETEFLEKIRSEIAWPKVDIIFAPHHGRSSGTLPKSILKEINPKIIVVGEAPCKDLEYYNDYNTITQNSSGDITFDCNSNEIDIYCSKSNYSVNYLKNKNKTRYKNYIGTLEI